MPDLTPEALARDMDLIPAAPFPAVAAHLRRLAQLERGGALVGIVREKDERIAEVKDRLAALEQENALLKDDNERKRRLLVARADEGMGQAFLARMDTLERENERLREAARHLLALKDGPRDAAYRAAKEPAWQALREALEGTDG